MSACAAGYVDHVDADVALAFADNALTPGERVEVERRIDACAVCRGAVAAAARETAGATKRDRPVAGPPAPRSSPLAAGDIVGRYVVERPLGAGGMGVVSLARDPELRRAVVIKLVRPDAHDEDLEPRLRREAQAMAQLSHPNVVQIFDIGRHGDRVFLAMEFIAGETLDAWLIEQERSVAEIIAMFLQAGAGLDAAHRAGLLHRDFKPQNVLVDRAGVAKVTDFGLARALSARESAAIQAPRMSGVHAVLTHANERIGTPAYMAPEQIAGAPLDARTDQYALALALLDALVGQQPARRTIKPSATPPELDAALAKTPVRARAAVIRALAIDPARRWPDLTSFLRELAPERRERRWWPLVAIAAFVIAGVAAFLAVRGTPATGCVAEAPRAWRRVRPNIAASLAARPRVFSTWHAAHVLDAVDRAADELGTQEVAHCESTPSAADKACVAQRRAALASAGALVADDPWLQVRAIASCVPVTRSPDAAALRAELFGAEVARAREIAGRASGLGDDLLHADALDLAANLEVAAGHFEEAATDFISAASVGERNGDDALRGRALLGLLDLARMRGDLGSARDQARQLDGMLARHGNAPEDVFLVASTAAAAWVELGDVPAAFAAIERASAAARGPDEKLRIRITRARALAILRWDPEAAARELQDAIAAGGGASPVARAAAWAYAADLALDRRDERVATQAIEAIEASGKSLDVLDKLRSLRVRAAALGVSGVSDELVKLGAPDRTFAFRIELARARMALDAGHGAGAAADLEALVRDMRDTRSAYSDEDPRIGLSAWERAEVWFLRCEAQLANQSYRNNDCMKPMPLDRADPQHPAFVRHHFAQARIYAVTSPHLESVSLGNAVELLAVAGARPLLLAETRLRLVRERARADRERNARAAREVFAAAGRTAEVAELDAILAEIDGRSVPTPPDAAPIDAPPRDATGDPWSP